MIWVVEGNGEGDLLDGHVLLQYVVGVDQKTVMWGGPTTPAAAGQAGSQVARQATGINTHSLS